MTHNQKGCFAEYHFAATAISLGFNVSTPLSSSSYYDCILEKNGKLFKIQVKYLGVNRLRRGNSMQITLRRTGLSSYEKKYESAHVLIKKLFSVSVESFLKKNIKFN